MYCMKCGRETKNDRAFCDECMEIMAQYPVKPGTPVRIPRRKGYEDRPVRRKKEISPEEQMGTMQNTIKWLSIVVVTLLAAMLLMGFFLLKDFLIEKEEEPTPMARNYTVVVDQGRNGR